MRRDERIDVPQRGRRAESKRSLATRSIVRKLTSSGLAQMCSRIAALDETIDAGDFMG
jgi:hypothetical protein